MVKSFIVYCSVFLPTLVAAQVWDFSDLQKLPANVNTDYEETAPLLSSDGKTLFFSRILYPQNEGGKFGGSDIWTSSATADGKWSVASPFPLNDRSNNSVIGISADGNTLFLLSTTGASRPSGIYSSKHNGRSWSRPELIPIPDFDPKGFLGFYVSPDSEVMFISMKADDSRGEEDLYVSTRNNAGQWSKPKNLGSSVNTQGFEISPFLSRDKRRLYFSSNGHKGLGDADIFYCDRLYNSWDTWSAPRNLGEKLNSKNFDAYFSLYGDSVAYFTSNRGGKYSDLFQVKVVPGNEVLAFGQRYLDSEEISKSLGANVSRRIVFDRNEVGLTAAQKELIFYIANKLSGLRDINFHVSVVEESNAALTQQRVDAIANQLREAGIENIRILTTNSSYKKQHPSKSTFEILLFK
jgi:hypothetical protein